MDVLGIYIFIAGHTEPNAGRISKIYRGRQGRQNSIFEFPSNDINLDNFFFFFLIHFKRHDPRIRLLSDLEGLDEID